MGDGTPVDERLAQPLVANRGMGFWNGIKFHSKIPFHD